MWQSCKLPVIIYSSILDIGTLLLRVPLEQTCSSGVYVCTNSVSLVATACVPTSVLTTQIAGHAATLKIFISSLRILLTRHAFNVPIEHLQIWRLSNHFSRL